MRLNIYGAIIPNDYKWYYDYWEEDCTCPRDVQAALEKASGETVDVYINSPGGEIASGSEIYTELRKYGNIKIHITGEACSAASVISMAGKSEMSPSALMMVHCVSTSPGHGNHTLMEHTAEMLRTADEALCTAYMAKSGKTKEEVLELMENETWLTAEQAKELGLIDEIMFEEPELLTASIFRLPSAEQMQKARQAMAEKEKPLTQQKLNLLKLRRM